jgi:hypothetical protein
MPIMGLSSSPLVMPVANKRDLCGARSRPFLILSLLNVAPLACTADGKSPEYETPVQTNEAYAGVRRTEKGRCDLQRVNL